MKSSAIVLVVLLAILLAALVAWVRQPATTAVETNTSSSTIVRTPVNTGASSTTQTTTPNTATGTASSTLTVTPVIIDLSANNYSFSQSAITAKRGQPVTINFKNTEGRHDFVIDEFADARTAVLDAGDQQTIVFIPNKTGTFEYYCSVGNHRQMGMKGTLTVTD